jgi:uncharacterized protein (TIGR02001 family)
MVLLARRGLRDLLLACAGVSAILPFATLRAEGRINGLVGVTSDYVFRGRSLTGGDPAWQAGIGYEHSSGAFGGVWASRVDFGPRWDHELEIDYVAGFGRDLHRDWWGEIALRRYTYPQSPDPLGYDYTEIGGMLRFRDLVTLSVAYSPSWNGYTSLGVVRSERLFAAEVGLQYPLRDGFSATGGLGQLEIAGRWGGTSLYWSAGVAHQYGRLTVDLSYYDTDSSARRLYGPTSVQGDVVAAVVYKF